MRKQTARFALAGLVCIAISAYVVSRTGGAEDLNRPLAVWRPRSSTARRTTGRVAHSAWRAVLLYGFTLSAVRIGPQLADVLAELRYRRGAGARRLAVPVPAAAAWALQTNNPVPPGLNCLRRGHYFRDK